jgi:hypothetical protein
MSGSARLWASTQPRSVQLLSIAWAKFAALDGATPRMENR